MTRLGHSDGGGAAGRNRPVGPHGHAVPEDADGGWDVLFLPLGPPLEIRSDGRPTGVKLELPAETAPAFSVVEE